MISEEKFWNQDLKNIINKLKLKGTYGLVGNDNIGAWNDRFFYMSEVNLNGSGANSVGDKILNGMSVLST